jgi:hypothetical protein
LSHSLAGDEESSEEEMRAAAVWIQDSDAPNCMICGKHFNTFIRRVRFSFVSFDSLVLLS